jgi:hypothetical protein
MEVTLFTCAKYCAGLIRRVALISVTVLLISCGGGDGGLPESINLTATALSPSSIELSWSADSTPGLIGYDLYRDGEGVEATHLSSTHYIDRGLSADTRYCYKVYAIVFPLGAVSTSNTACAKTGAYSTSGWTFTDAPAGYAPDFRISPSGAKLIAYLQSDGLHYGLNTGAVWTNELVDGHGGAPSLGVDTFGNAHVAYGNVSVGGVYHASNSTGIWTTEAVNATGVGISTLAIDKNGALHIVFSDYNAAYDFYDYWYVTNVSGAWVKSHIFFGSNRVFRDLALIVDGSGTVHMAYAITDFTSCGLAYGFKKPDVEWDWSMSPVDNGAGCKVSLALDSSDVLHASYRKSMQIIHARLNAGTWSKEVVDSLSWLGGDEVGMGIDMSDYLHISYGDENGDLKYATNRGGMWAYTYLDKVTSTNILRMGSDGHAYILYSPDSTGALRLARSP